MIQQERRSTWLSAALLAALALLAGPAQAGTTGQLAGYVVDADGTPLPGVSVAASSPSQIGGIQMAKTDLNGWFQYPRLSPGDYSVRIELHGFLTQELAGIRVRLDHMTELRVTLPLATFGDEVEVVASAPVVDPEQVSAGQTFTAEYLQEVALGMENRYYLGMLGQAAGAQKGSRYGIEVMGSGWSDNNFQIDGMDATDPYDQLPGFGSLSFEAVEEVTFHTAGFEAEYGRATGGVVNLITKSGGNQFRGSVDYRYSDSDLQSSGAHWDPDEQPTESSDLNASFGGPLLLDRLWFFIAMQSFNDELTPFNAQSTRTWSEQNYLGKLTWQPGSSWIFVGRTIFNPIEWDYSGSGQFRTPEATWLETWETLNGQVDLSGVLSDSVLVEFRAGANEAPYDFIPRTRDFTTIGHYNYDTGLSHTNVSSENHDERSRREVNADVSWFVDDLGGTHDFKTGLRYTDSGFMSNSCYVGGGQSCTAGVEGFFFYDIVDEQGENAPLFMDVEQALGRQRFSGSVWSVYLQDSWRVRPELTLKLGLRWDSSRQTNDVGQEIADLAMLQPRFGVAWDIRGRGRDILRGSWGRYMHPSALAVAEFTAGRSTPIEAWLSCANWFGVTDPVACADLAASEGWGYRTDQEDWDSAGWILQPWWVFASEPNQTAPGLEPMYADELVLAYERELYHRTSLEVSYVRKETKQLLEDTCNGNVPTPTEGADCSFWYLTNLPGLAKDYEGFMLRLESRAHNRFHVIGSYVLSSSKGVHNGLGLGSQFDVYPYHFVNQYGYLGNHSRHRVKLNGFARLPMDFSVALGGWWNSEFRWAPVRRRGLPYGSMLLEPRGSRSEPGDYQIDLQVGKGFSMRRVRLRAFATVYNLLDSETAQWVCPREHGCGEYELGDATAWQQPRRYEWGLRVEF